MATNTFVELSLPEAKLLADYTGIEYDLRTASDFARRLVAERNKEDPDWSLVEPLTAAVIVRYARSFVKGMRAWLGEEALKTFSPDQLAKHSRLYAIRDKYVAHSVNAFEESRPVARYWVERVNEEGITEIGCQHYRITGLSIQELQDVVELTTTMLRYVAARLVEEKARVLAIVRAMPLDNVLSRRDQWVPPVPNPDPSTRRKHP